MDSSDTSAAPESKLHFLDYWRIIRIRKAIILFVFFLTTIIATVVTFLMHPQYSSTSEIEIEPDISDVSPYGTTTIAPYDPYFIETQLKIIEGDVVLTRVIDDLNLAVEWGKKFNPDGQPFKMNEALTYLRHDINLDANRNTKTIDVTVYSEDKDLAANIANTLVGDYKNYRLELYRQRMTGGIKTLEQDYQDEENKIQEQQAKVDQLQQELDINDPGGEGQTAPTPTLSAQQVQQLNELLIEGKAAYTKLLTQLTELQSIQATNPIALRDVLPTALPAPDPELSDLLSKLHENEQKYASETNYIGAKNPDLTATISDIQEENNLIDARVQGIMIAMKTQVMSQKATVDSLNEQVQDYEKTNDEEAVRGEPYWEAKQTLENMLEVQRMNAAKVDEIKDEASIPTSTFVTVVNPGTPGELPVRPQKTLYISFGAFFGLLIGISLAFFIEYLDTSIKTIDEVERVFQLPVLGVIPQNVGKLMEEGADSSHAEAYRVLRTNLLFSRKGENLNSLVVVSAGMGEGKSTTALNLATVFAQSGQRTLVVDSDLRRPTLHKLLQLSNNFGLVSYLLKQNKLEEVVQATAVPMLDFMASGKLPSISMNILGSEPMKNLINELKKRYDFIVFDSPPIMGLSDASVLASEVDMAIQVIQYRRYPQMMNIRAKQMVEKVGGNLVGIVLNNINMAGDESYYYYGGYYYYHSNEDARQTTPKNPASGNGDSSGDGGRVGIQQKY